MTSDKINDTYLSEGIPESSVVSFDQARSLAAEYGTPLLACDITKVAANYKRFKELLPGVDLFYAVKANPLPEIITELVRIGSSFDVASKNEIDLCLDCGADPKNLLYANPIKAPESIRYAHKNGVDSFTFDSFAELEKIAANCPGAKVILRLVVKDAGSYCKFSTKFGARTKESVDMLRMAKELGLDPIGLSFHVGSQCMRLGNFASAIDACAKVFSKAKKEGIDLSIIDLGGGIPIRYVKDTYSMDELADLIKQKAKDLFPEGVRFIMEPGRPMVGNCMTLITRVIGTSKRGDRECVYLDDGCYNSLSEKIFGHCEYRIVSDSRKQLVRYTVFGPTCDSVDVITNDTYLPEIGTGDILLVLNTGAYTNAAATHFNGFPPAKIVFV